MLFSPILTHVLASPFCVFLSPCVCFYVTFPRLFGSFRVALRRLYASLWVLPRRSASSFCASLGSSASLCVVFPRLSRSSRVALRRLSASFCVFLRRSVSSFCAVPLFPCLCAAFRGFACLLFFALHVSLIFHCLGLPFGTDLAPIWFHFGSFFASRRGVGILSGTYRGLGLF